MCRKDPKLIAETDDHKPEKKGERERLEAAGTEVPIIFAKRCQHIFSFSKINPIPEATAFLVSTLFGTISMLCISYFCVCICVFQTYGVFNRGDG